MSIINEIESLNEFYNILQNNKRVVVLKFGAEWCAPCKKIKTHIDNWFQKIAYTDSTKNIKLVYIDVDESFELYAYLKTKRMIQGIPSILAYYKGNTTFVFDDFI